MSRRPQTAESFWSRVLKLDGVDACWEWQGGLVFGYGNVSFGNRTFRAHRIAWVLTHGKIPRGLVVCHRCDNRKCVRPSHLFVGTQLDNIRDRDAKGRRSDVRRGEASNLAKLTELEVGLIRWRALCGETQASIGRDFGIGQDHVSRIASGRIWPGVLPRF